MTDLASLFATVEAQIGTDAQWHALEQAEIAGMASLHTPRHGNNWDTQMWSIDVGAAKAVGDSKREVMRNWLKVAAEILTGDHDRPDQLARAIATIEGPHAITLAEATEAAGLITAHPDGVPPLTVARAIAVLAAIARANAPTGGVAA